MILQIDDATALRYQTAAAKAGVPLQRFLERHLAKLVDVPTGQRILILSGDTLEQVDQLLGLGSTASPAAFLQAVEGWAGITIGDIRLAFTPAQLGEIAHRAEKQGKTPEAIVADIVEQLNQNFFMDPVVAR